MVPAPGVRHRIDTTVTAYDCHASSAKDSDYPLFRSVQFLSDHQTGISYIAIENSRILGGRIIKGTLSMLS